MISIITTAYKHEKFIAATIESVLAQTYTDWELLIGDDSPDEKTYQIIQKYEKKYPKKIKSFHNKPNKGIVENMNFLISKASGEYIAFLEGDDLFTPENLEKKIDIFNQYPEVALVYNNLDFIDLDGNIIKKNFLTQNTIKNSKINFEKFINGEIYYLSYSSLMIKKNILDKIKIQNISEDKNFSVSDWDLFFRAAKDYNIYGLEESLTLYRRHSSSVSQNNQKIFDDIILQLKYYLAQKIITQKDFDTKMSFLSILKGVDYVNSGNKKNGFSELKKSFQYKKFDNIFYKIGLSGMLILPKKLNQYILKKIIKKS